MLKLRIPRRVRLMLYLIAIVSLSTFWYRLSQGRIFYVAQNPDAPPLATCTEAEIQAALSALPTYEPSSAQGFATIQDGGFVIDGAPHYVRGVNYFPVYYPWRRYLTESDLTRVDAEFALLEESGFNTIRTFLWYEPMFLCPGSGAIPVAEVFQRLDGILHAAAAHNLRIILTLHDTPDQVDYPLYTNPAHTQAQTSFIIQRYRDEAAILAWDLRNEGDIDYGSRDGPLMALFPRWQVLDWLADASFKTRLLDAKHLITAGWMTDAGATVPHVDFVSFHHWWDGADLRRRIAELRGSTDKPILVEEFGYSTSFVSEAEQATNIREIIAATEDENVLGWLIWTAFDFPLDATCMPPACPDLDNPQHHYGIWHTDYTPKPAAETVLDWLQAVAQ